MLEIETSGAGGCEGPDCTVCGARTWLCGRETHPVVSALTMVTYVCFACEANRVEIVGNQPPENLEEASVN